MRHNKDTAGGVLVFKMNYFKSTAVERNGSKAPLVGSSIFKSYKLKGHIIKGMKTSSSTVWCLFIFHLHRE